MSKKSHLASAFKTDAGSSFKVDYHIMNGQVNVIFNAALMPEKTGIYWIQENNGLTTYSM